MFDKNIKAKLVCDQKSFFIPMEMGQPSPDQLQGTLAERLSELCCRVCYDSLGKGRSSEKMHEHLLDVQHWSVYEHFHWTVDMPDLFWDDKSDKALLALLNRPGLRVVSKDSGLRITLNLRHLLDWDRWTKLSYLPDHGVADHMFDQLLGASLPVAPLVFQRLKPYNPTQRIEARAVESDFPCEKFVTCFLSGGRGMSHEQVRHRFAMSQRSTRYVDESGSPIVEHPLISKYMEETPGNEIQSIRRRLHFSCGQTYDNLVCVLEKWLIDKGVDKFTARKQARGAARNDLGNGLATEMMFTANLDMWDAMIRLRCNPAADAEIRVMYAQVLTSLQESQYGDHFKKFTLEPSPDGLGQVAVEKK
jgi:thymidylate synthase ThyX